MLSFLDKNGIIEDTDTFCLQIGITREQLDPVLKSLVAEDYLKVEVIERKLIELTDEGKSYS